MNRRGHQGKTDANQTEIVDALRAMGVVVRSLAGVGDGMNDLLCACRGELWLLECKVPGEHLTPKQKAWHAECPWRNHVAYTIGDALLVAQHYLNKGRIHVQDAA